MKKKPDLTKVDTHPPAKGKYSRISGNTPQGSKAQLKIAAHVVIQLGQELVTDVEQAFLELAKNAYDADAKECVITIDPAWAVDNDDPVYALLDPDVAKAAPSLPESKQRKVGRVLITDTGIGASELGVIQGWLTISGSLKRSKRGPKKETDKGRTPVGDKGLGRLATMKIGDLLLFRTAQAQEPIERVACFSWGQFPRVQTIDQITVDQWEIKRDRPYSAGSVVEVVGLHDRERWQREENIQHLVARLSTLVNPYLRFKDFDIQLRYGKKIFELQKIGAEVLNFAAARFEFKWSGKTLEKRAYIGKGLFRGTTGEESKAKFDMVFSPEHFPTLQKKFRESKRLSHRGVNVDNPENGSFAQYVESDDIAALGDDVKRPMELQCGPFAAKFYYFMFNEEFTNKIQGNAASSEQVREMSGILVFRDGFRVRIGDDWLGLSSGTTTGSFHSLRPKNTLGYFSVTNKENPNLIEKSDREGFVDNKAFQQFLFLSDSCKKYANEILNGVREDFNELYHSLLLETDEIATPRQARVKLKETRKQASSEMLMVRDVAAKAIKRIEHVKSTLGDARRSKAAAGEIEGLFTSFSQVGAGLVEIQKRVQEIDRASDAMESFRSDEANKNLRLLESAAVGLTARVLSHELMTYVGQIEDATRVIAIQNKKLGDKAINDALQELSSTVRELRKVISSIDPLLPGSRSIKETHVLGQVIAKYLDGREGTILAKGAKIKVTGIDLATRFRFSRTRFHQILENLLQNSLYWLQKHREQGASANSLIRVAINEKGFEWWDTGPGVVDRYEDSLFDPFVSNKPRGEGQGLGLYIVATYLESERCSVSLLPTRNASGRRYKFRVDLSGALVED